jgi:uncharacterized FAD-dependent dehydrogenase
VAEEKETIKIKLLNLRHPFNETHDLRTLISQFLGIQEEEIAALQILRRAIDARQDRLDVVYTLAVEIAASKKAVSELCRRKDIEPYHPPEISVTRKISRFSSRPIIIGCGPSGVFAALTLAERGVPSLIIERGARMAQRIKDVNGFWKDGTLNPESNVFFGEGGAGTFSDGKLTTRIKSPLKKKVLQELVNLGAPEEIRFINKPHLGSDRIRRIIQLFVQSLEQRGVEFLFNTQMKGIQIGRAHV